MEAVRSSGRDSSEGPPAWRFSVGLIRDGLRVALLLAGITLPFALAFWPLSLAIYAGRSVISTQDAFLDRAYALLAALAVLALPWGLAMLLVVPAGLAGYAAGGRTKDLLDPAATMRLLRGDFAGWNLALATIVTAWALGLVGAGLLCAGAIPGAFYAILVSAHATSRIRPAPSPAAADPPAR